MRGLFGINQRISYLIDEKGFIDQVIEDPDCSLHGEEMLKMLS